MDKRGISLQYQVLLHHRHIMYVAPFFPQSGNLKVAYYIFWMFYFAKKKYVWFYVPKNIN